jgi:hypothetical protein
LFVIALIIADATSFLTFSFRQAFMMIYNEKLIIEVSTHHSIYILQK